MWSIAKGILWLLDGFFDVLDTIWRFKFFDNEYVNKVFSASIIVACSWLVLKVVIELIMNYQFIINELLILLKALYKIADTLPNWIVTSF